MKKGEPSPATGVVVKATWAASCITALEKAKLTDKERKARQECEDANLRQEKDIAAYLEKVGSLERLVGDTKDLADAERDGRIRAETKLADAPDNWTIAKWTAGGVVAGAVLYFALDTFVVIQIPGG